MQTTKVEELDQSKPGLRQLVDLMLDGHKTLEEIAAAVEKNFQERIALSTLSSYKQRRWQVQKKRVEEIKNHAQAIMELVAGGRAISDIQQALLFEQVQGAMDAGTKLDPQFAMREQRLWAEQQLRREELEQQKQALELKIESQRKALEEATDEARQKAGRGESLTVQDINHIRERVFGAESSGGAQA